jgi:hypothetical protein
MTRPLRILMSPDLRDRKGIRMSRQQRNRQIAAGNFPPPDGRTTDHPQSPPFWFETTIDRYIRSRAAALRRAASSTSNQAQPTRAPSPAIGKGNIG